MVRVNTIDSKEESRDIAKRKDLEEEPMADGSDESSKAKTTESYRVLSHAAVTGIIVTIGIGLFTENILKNECSSEDDHGDHKPDSSHAEKSEQRNDHVSAHEKNLNGSTRNPAVLNKDRTKENKSQSDLLSQNNFEHFSNWNSSPEQMERVTQVASAVRHEEPVSQDSEKINKIVLFQARSNYAGIPPISSAITNADTSTMSTKEKERFNLCSEEKNIDKSQNNVALQVCGSEHNTTSFGINIKCKDKTESSSDPNVDEEVRAQEPVSHSLSYLTELNKPKETIASSMTSNLNDMFPQDNHITLTSEPCPESIVKLPSQTIINKKQKNPRQQLVLSKSLDLHRTCLEKGCKLLETKPAKSSLRRSGSEESLKKYVHFPEDIRHIRKVHKYDSLDDIIFLKTDKWEEETDK